MQDRDDHDDVGKVRRFDHPGKGRGRARSVPKGRQVEPHARDAIAALLADGPRERHLLIEYLHLVQDTYGQISAAHLAALADEMRLSFAEVYETATFYAHFDVVKEGAADIPPITVRVCDSLTCCMLGADPLLAALKKNLGDAVRVVRAPCVGLCDQAPAVEVGHNFVTHATVDSVKHAVTHRDTHPHIPDYIDFEAYRAAGGYVTLERLRTGALSVEQVLKALDDGSLRGLGGAGFPTGRKWRSVRGEPGPRLMAVNADEGEPGTFKDQFFLNSDPHRFLEGTLIGAHVVEATDVYLYIRDEYPIAREILATEIAKLPAGGPALHLRRGAGAYICGEESSLIESIEGKRGLPRHKPPFPFQVGIFGRPTLIKTANVFTGWSYYSTAAKPSFYGSPADWYDPMQLYPTYHDNSQKTIVAQTAAGAPVILPANEGGTADLSLELDTLYHHQNAAPFFCRQLIQRLVTSNPSPGYVYRVAQVFANDGTGTRGNLGAVVRAILLDYEARSPALVGNAGTGKLKEPILRQTALYRAFSGSASNGRFAVFNSTASLGQAPLASPTVFNFFPPDYVPPGTLAAAGLSGPEFNITTASTAISAANILYSAVYTSSTPSASTIVLDLSALTSANGNSTSTLLATLGQLFCGGAMSAGMQQRIAAGLAALPQSAQPLDRARFALELVATSPEAAVQQ